MKLRGSTTKWLLRQLALRRGVPEDLVLRPKQGFGVPIATWFRGEQREWVDDLVSTDRGYFDPAATRRLLDEHAAGTADRSSELWILAMLELWQRQLVDA